MICLTLICFFEIHELNFKKQTQVEKVQVGKAQEKAQSEKDFHSKNQGGKNQTNNQVLIPLKMSSYFLKKDRTGLYKGD